jgi:imidazolonepropionase
MSRTRHASKTELLKLGIERAFNAMRFGITTIEMKSGYGLSFEDEIKILEVINELRTHVPVDIVSTFLGAHTIPPEFSNHREGYVELICEKMIPHVAQYKLAEFCDVFCETNVFTIEETRKIFEAAKHYGLKLKLHADQLTHTGGAELCAEMGAVSADHLEHISGKGIEALKNSKVVAGLLPGCSFFLNMQYAPARKLIDAGIPVALATDFNPGSCMTQNLQMVMSIACTQMRMTPAEAIQAVTLNAARALDREDIGNIRTGMKADLVLFRVPNYQFIPYNFAQNHIEKVIKNGKIIV